MAAAAAAAAVVAGAAPNQPYFLWPVLVFPSNQQSAPDGIGTNLLTRNFTWVQKRGCVEERGGRGSGRRRKSIERRIDLGRVVASRWAACVHGAACSGLSSYDTLVDEATASHVRRKVEGGAFQFKTRLPTGKDEPDRRPRP